MVAAPLLSLMRDQVASLTEHGVSAAMIGAGKTSDEKIKAGRVSVVFTHVSCWNAWHFAINNRTLPFHSAPVSIRSNCNLFALCIPSPF